MCIYIHNMYIYTGSLPVANAILSTFPQLLADPPAAHVLMFMWANEAPKWVLGKLEDVQCVHSLSLMIYNL